MRREKNWRPINKDETVWNIPGSMVLLYREIPYLIKLVEDIILSSREDEDSWYDLIRDGKLYERNVLIQTQNNPLPAC